VVELRKIDKATYKKRLNQVQGGAVVALFALSLSLSELYRALWADGESSFWLNAAGVVTAALLVAGVFRFIKAKPWMSDIVYTWELKKELNRIYRHTKYVEAGLAEQREEAFKVHYFSLHGSRHLYQIEDNTLTLPELNEKIDELDQQLEAAGLSVSITDYEPWLLEALKS
jgi:hypothetical protein